MSDKDTAQQQLDLANQNVSRAREVMENPLVQAMGTAASAAVFHKAIKSRTMARLSERSKRFLEIMNHKGSTHALEDMSFKEMRQYMQTAKEAWSAAGKDMDKIHISDSIHGLFGMRREAVQLEEKRAREMARKEYRDMKTEQFQLQAQEFTKNMKRSERDNMNAFVASVVNHPEDLDRIWRTRRQHGLDSGDIGDFTSQLVKDIRDEMLPRTDEAKEKQAAFLKELEGKFKNAFHQVNQQTFGTIEGLQRILQQEDDSALKRMASKVTGNHAGTIKEFLQAVEDDKVEDRQFIASGKKDKDNSFIHFVQDLDKEFQDRSRHSEEEYKKFLNLNIDVNGFRVTREGHAYSNDAQEYFQEKFFKVAANTLPGSILKLRELHNAFHLPSAGYIGDLSNDPLMKGYLKKIGHENADVIYQGKNVYSIDYEGNATLLNKELEENGIELNFVSGQNGFWHSLVHTISGQDKVQRRETDNLGDQLLDYFRIGTDREKWDGSLTHHLGSAFTNGKNPNSRKNIIGNLFSPNSKTTEGMQDASLLDNETAELKRQIDYGPGVRPEEARIAEEDAIADRLFAFNKMLDIQKDNTYGLTTDQIAAFKQAFKDGSIASNERAQQLLSLMESTKSASEKLEMLSPVTSEYRDTEERPFLSGSLGTLVNKYNRDARGTQALHQNVTDPTLLSIGSSTSDLFFSSYNNAHMSEEEIVQKALSEEFMLSLGTHKGGGKVDYNQINEAVQGAASGMTKEEGRHADELAQTVIAKNYIEDPFPKNAADYNEKLSKAQHVDELAYKGEEEWQKHYRQTAQEMADNEISKFERTGDEDEAYYASRPLNDVITVRKGISLSLGDMLGALNGETKARAKFKGFFKQFTAGIDDKENVTEYTMLPLFFGKRLSNDLNEIAGLGLDGDSFTSVPKMLKDMTMKRLLPAALIYNYGDWTDDTAQQFTGKSPIGSLAGGLANVDLAFRKTVSALGMDDWMKQMKSINPIWQYYGEHDDYQDYDERRKYYQSGYEPVRKARGWTFGGVGEARGGEIEYYEPTFVRRLQSDYKDVSLYGSYWNKWSHSLLPTPLNPLSPFAAIMDPYWLEKQHEDDRPYPISGAMFQSGTPWGAILNPTVGRIIKPQKELHPWRFRNGVDMKSLLSEINESIKQGARNLTNTNDLLLNGANFTAVNYNAYNAPTDSNTEIRTIRTDANGEIISDTTSIYGSIGSSGAGGTGGSAAAASALSVGSFGLGGYSSNPQAGFNKLTTESDTNSNLYDYLMDQGHGARNLLDAGRFHPKLKDVLRETLFGNGQPVVHEGDIMVNDKGELGTYSQHRHGTPDLTLKEKLEIGSHIDNPILSYLEGQLADAADALDPRAMLGRANKRTKIAAAEKADTAGGVDDTDGFTSNVKLSAMRPSNAMELLEDPDSVAELVHAGKGSDFVKDATSSWRLIGGIYGYLGAETAGIGSYDNKVLATSSDMDSYTRGFWDMNTGGFGGNLADIIHRFIPDFKRGQRINPLMNEMPSWMPERFRYGDAYAAIPSGEARLPGKGYETLNQLHPDAYGRYGAFDRMKILADIAPFSPEYKLWKQIAKKTVTDPELQDEMTEIQGRVNNQGKKHDFFDYKVLGHGLDYQNIVVSEILGYGKFRSGDKIYKVAGISVKSHDGMSMEDVLGQYLHPGMQVTIATDSQEAYSKNRDSDATTNAAVFIDGESLSTQMVEAGDAQKRKGDSSAAATLANMSAFQKIIGGASEFIAHLDIPWLSDQFLRVRSPYESYKAEQVYGTPYQSWDHPINTFLRPALERAIYERTALTDVMNYGYHHLMENRKLGKDLRHGVQAVHFLSNRASFIGAAVGNLVAPRNGKLANYLDKKLNVAVDIAHFATGGNSMLDEASSGAIIGYEIAKRMEHPEKKTRLGMAAGAAAGVAMRFLHSNNRGVYIPERTREKWDMQDYFDRLTYLKYMGLYHEAARMAKKKDGVDVEDIVEQTERRSNMIQARIKKLKKFQKALHMSNHGETDDNKDYLSDLLNSKINALASEQPRLLDGSKWAMSALIYKQAADATMQGLKKNSSWSQIVTALPTNDREYFMEFVKESDPERRERIMQIASPFLRKALNLAWGKGGADKSDRQKRKDNERYFKRHRLPGANWRGWTPDVDLNDVEVKTVANEAMNLSDFGYYESQLRDQKVQRADALEYRHPARSSGVARDIKQILEGKGLRNVNVDVTARANLGASQIKMDVKSFFGFRNQQQRVQSAMNQQMQ